MASRDQFVSTPSKTYVLRKTQTDWFSIICKWKNHRQNRIIHPSLKTADHNKNLKVKKVHLANYPNNGLFS